MLNFNYSVPTKILFGKHKIDLLAENIKEYGSKVLLVYGGGSIKRNGIYDTIIDIFAENNISSWELGGVKPNPRISSVKEGIEICKKQEIDLILAVGGGSTIDCAKVIGAGFYHSGDPWEIVTDSRKIEDSLPIATVLTLAATGSEMNAGAVITNLETQEKLGTGHPSMAPKFSILDPTYTFTVPEKQTAAGTADIMSHIFEVYFSKTKGAYVQNRMAESLLKTAINYGTKALAEPENYEARANLMWTASLAINGLLSSGKETEWSVHAMEHELSAFYDITHGTGLAILTPYWMEYSLNDNTLDKFVEYGVNVWGIDSEQDKYKIAQTAIEKTREYFSSLGIPAKLSEVGIEAEKLEKMAEQATRRGELGNFKPLSKEDVLNIYQKAL